MERLTIEEARSILIDLQSSIGREGKVHPRDAMFARVLLAILDGEITLPVVHSERVGPTIEETDFPLISKE
jgi:hypothetical protein